MVYLSSALARLTGNVQRSNRRLCFHLTVLCFTLFPFTMSPQAEQAAESAPPPVALVIGNGQYSGNWTELSNPERDAEAVRKALSKLGFEMIKVEDNLDRMGMIKAVERFRERLSQTRGLGWFFYSGHGMEVEGQNYLIPVDPELESIDQIPSHALGLDWIQDQLSRAGHRISVIMLDACRNRPLRSTGQKGLEAIGFQDHSQTQALGANYEQLIAYSTAARATALDGAPGEHSPYAKALLSRLTDPRDDLVSLLNQVNQSVKRETDQRQNPWLSYSSFPKVYLAGRPSQPVDGDFLVYGEHRPESDYLTSLVPLAALLGVMLCAGLGAVGIARHYRIQHRQLQELQRTARPVEGLRQLQRFGAGLLPQPSLWKKQRHAWQQNLTEASEKAESAEAALKRGDLEAARSLAQAALQLNADQERALDVLQSLPALQHAQTVLTAIRQPGTPALVAWMQLSQALSLTKTHALLASTTASLNDLCQTLGETLRPHKGPLALTCAGEVMTVLEGTTVHIGRTAQDQVAEITLGFRRISRAGRQTILRRVDQALTVEDLGSSNGTQLDGRSLASGSPARVSGPCQLTLGGQTEDTLMGSVGPCRLLCEPDREAEGTWLFRLDKDWIALWEGALAERWPGLNEDLLRRWAWLAEGLSLGFDQKGWDPGCVRGTSAVLRLSRHRKTDEWHLSPVPGSADVKVAGVALLSPVRLIEGMVLQVGAHRVHFVSGASTDATRPGAAG